MLEVISHLANGQPEYKPTYMEERVVKNVAIIVVTSDKGLCGGLNANLLRTVTRFTKDLAEEGKQVCYCLIGTKGRAFFKAYGGKIISATEKLGDDPSIEEDVLVILLEDTDLDFVVPLESHNPNSIRVLAHSHDKSLLLRKENYHPNWNLTVNHAPHKIDRTSENFQIISLDPGVNDLVFTYESIYDLLHRFTLYSLFFFYFCMIIVLSFNNSDLTRKFQRSLPKEPRTD